jgi:hypothetical protein
VDFITPLISLVGASLRVADVYQDQIEAIEVAIPIVDFVKDLSKELVKEFQSRGGAPPGETPSDQLKSFAAFIKDHNHKIEEFLEKISQQIDRYPAPGVDTSIVDREALFGAAARNLSDLDFLFRVLLNPSVDQAILKLQSDEIFSLVDHVFVAPRTLLLGPMFSSTLNRDEIAGGHPENLPFYLQSLERRADRKSLQIKIGSGYFPAAKSLFKSESRDLSATALQTIRLEGKASRDPSPGTIKVRMLKKTLKLKSARGQVTCELKRYSGFTVALSSNTPDEPPFLIQTLFA